MTESKVLNGGTCKSDKEELDIRVQYPSEVNSSSEFERILPKHEEKQLVVVLLGWAGAEHKYLSKYSDFYLNRGCIIMRYITPLQYHYVGARKLPYLAKGILKYIQQIGLSSHPIFFHVFSNGGANTYSYILKELASPKSSLKMDVKGTIFDSAPSPRKLKTSFKAILSIFSNRNILIRYAIACTTIFLLACQIFWYNIKTATSLCVFGESLEPLENPEKESAPLSNWLESIASAKNHSFLFLFSTNDELIPAENIECFAKVCESRGNRVEKMRFEGSEHVMHFRRYPKEYGNAVINFIRSTMNLPEPT